MSQATAAAKIRRLSSELSECKAAYEALKKAQGVSDGMVLVDRGVLHMVINALRRDAEEGKAVRGEMADMLYTHPAQQAKPQPLSDEQIDELIDRFDYTRDGAALLARAVEQAHGIKGE